MARNRYLPRHLATACALMTTLAVSACGGGDAGSEGKIVLKGKRVKHPVLV